jgi:hypothetical protein
MVVSKATVQYLISQLNNIIADGMELVKTLSPYPDPPLFLVGLDPDRANPKRLITDTAFESKPQGAEGTNCP